MIDKATVEQVFSKFFVVDPPESVLILNKPAAAVDGDHVIFFRGLTPMWRSDMIILTPQGDEETLLHEALHQQFRAREISARIGGKVLVQKHNFLSRRPIAGDFWDMFVGQRNVRYEVCAGCQTCNGLVEELRIFPPEECDPTHLKLVSVDG